MTDTKPSMGYLDFRRRVERCAAALSDFNCPMVFVLPSGEEVRFADVEVDLADAERRSGGATYQVYEYRIKLKDKGGTRDESDNQRNNLRGNG